MLTYELDIKASSLLIAYESRNANHTIRATRNTFTDQDISVRSNIIDKVTLLFIHSEYQSAYTYSKRMLHRFVENGCPEIMSWKFFWQHAKADIYVHPESNMGYELICRTIWEMEQKRQQFLESGRHDNPFRLCTEQLGRFNSLGGYHNWINAHNLDSAIKMTKQALVYLWESHSLEDYATACDNLGRMYAEKGDYQKAETFVRTGYKKRIQLKNQYRIALSLISMANISISRTNWEPAITYLREAERICIEHNQTRGKALIYIAYGRAYRQLGLSHKHPLNRRKKFFLKSLAYLSRAKEIFSTTITEPIRLTEIDICWEATHRDYKQAFGE
jgi:tetratricopeptide (TPR) repeat protein